MHRGRIRTRKDRSSAKTAHRARLAIARVAVASVRASARSVRPVASDEKPALTALRVDLGMRMPLVSARNVPRESTKTRKRAHFARRAVLVLPAAVTGQAARIAKSARPVIIRTTRMPQSALRAQSVNLAANPPIAPEAMTTSAWFVRSGNFETTQV